MPQYPNEVRLIVALIKELKLEDYIFEILNKQKMDITAV